MTIHFPESLNVMRPELATITQQGQPDTFLVVLEMFIQQYESFEHDIENAILTSNGPELHILIHTLKGTSGALGLQKLHEISTELDLQLTQRIDLENLNVTDLVRYTKLSIADSRAILDFNSGPHQTTSPEPDHDLATLLQQLKHKLKHHEHIAPPFMAMLKAVLDERDNERYAQVLHLVDQFDYSAAYDSLIKIEQDH